MMIPLCRHIFPGGTLCQGPAVHDTDFCRHHQMVKTTLAQAGQPVAYGAPPQLPFLFAEDRAAIQLNLMMVLKALNDGKIDSRTANSMTRVLNSCMRNLKAGPLTDPNAKDVARTVIKTPDGEEIAPPREAPEDRAQGKDDSVDTEDGSPTPDNPYADLYHLPSPEFAYRVYERATQIHEAKRAAERERCALTLPESASADVVEEPALSKAVDLTGAIQNEEPAAPPVVIPGEPTTAADSDSDDESADVERRFREWQQSPQGQSFERMYGKLGPHLQSPQPVWSRE